MIKAPFVIKQIDEVTVDSSIFENNKCDELYCIAGAIMFDEYIKYM